MRLWGVSPTTTHPGCLRCTSPNLGKTMYSQECRARFWESIVRDAQDWLGEPRAGIDDVQDGDGASTTDGRARTGKRCSLGTVRSRFVSRTLQLVSLLARWHHRQRRQCQRHRQARPQRHQRRQFPARRRQDLRRHQWMRPLHIMRRSFSGVRAHAQSGRPSIGN